MEINFWEMLARTTGAFFAILFLARLIGKKQLSQLTFFHYVTGITFGSIAAEISAQVETPFWDGIISLIWWSALTILVSYLTLKSNKLRVLFDDKPAILIQKGTLIPRNIKKARLSNDEVLMLLREQNIFSVSDVEYAIFETNGQLTVMKKAAVSNATKQDVKANITSPQNLPTEVIDNGKVIIPNLLDLNLTEEWLQKKLKRKNVMNVEDVYLAQVLEDGSLYISLKEGAPLNPPS